MNDAHKIAVFGKDVYILYIAEMAQDCMFLLYLLTLEKLKNFRLADEYFNESRFSQIQPFGK
jgi:hypothetical protein